MKKIIKEMKILNLVGKKFVELTNEEKESLKISGYYPETTRLEMGEHQITVDFENGLSVAGTLVVTEDEVEIVIDDEGIIYDPAE